MKKFLSLALCLVLLAGSVFSFQGFAYEPDQEIKSEIALLVSLDGDGSVLYAKNADQKTQPASLSKIMTAIVVIEAVADLDGTVITAQSEAIDVLSGSYSTVADIEPGDQYSALDLLYLMMLRSANDATNILAQHVSGSIDAFVDKMNETAKKIGCENTVFMNAHGLDADGQYTTANDMAKIVRYGLKLPVLETMGKATSYTIAANDTHSENTIANNNDLIPSTPSSFYNYDYATGLKAGGTNEAGYCIAATAARDSSNYLAIVMQGSMETYDGERYNSALIDARRLFRWSFTNFKVKEITNENVVVTHIPVKLSADVDQLALVPSGVVSGLVPTNVDASTIIIEPIADTMPEYVKAPVKKGDVICKASVIHAGTEIMQIDLVASEDIGYSSILYLGHLIGSFFNLLAVKIIGIVLGTAILIYLFMAWKARNRRKKNKLKVVRSYRDF